VASQRLKRGLRGVLATGLVAAGLTVLPVTPALADPTPPANASEAEKQLSDLGHQAEVLTEQMHDAQISLDSANADKATAQGQLGAAQAALSDAQAQQQQYQGTVDTLAAASYQGARLNRLSALMTSRSPQDLLDQMSGLELLASDTSAQLAVFQSASSAATQAQSDAQVATDAAQTAADQASSVQTDIQAKQAALETQTAAVRAAFSRLSVPEQVSYAGTPVPAGYTAPAPGSGSGQGYAALQAALTKVGSPYSWGATGPNSFDCSGLTSWAFAQAGVSIPRSSGAQAGSGAAVSRADLQPGDLVFFYSPISHVGIYAGNGMVVHSPTFGQGVKVAPMDQMPYSSARRY
jgi:cell wall-associated NlpC family hydrolase